MPDSSPHKLTEWLSRSKGILITLASFLFIELMERTAFPIAYPGLIYLPAVAFATFIGGTGVGLISGALALLYETFLSTTRGQFFQTGFNDQQRFIVEAIAISAMIAMVGVLKDGIETYSKMRAERVRIAEREAVQEALRESEEKYRTLWHNSVEAICMFDAETARVLEVNPQFLAITGFSDEEATRLTLYDIVAEDRESIDRDLYAVLTRGPLSMGERLWRRKDGSLVPVEENVSVIRLGGKEIVYSIARDITERKQAESELRYMSVHDGLTGLYNRGFFGEELTRLERGRQFPVSIVMADVDNLKGTNDREGHAAGDDVLKRAAQILTDTFRAEDIVARIGGDEFAVLLPGTDVAAATVALKRLDHFLQEHNEAHAAAPVHISFGASTAEKHASLTNVLREADEKMYRAKRGRNIA